MTLRKKFILIVGGTGFIGFHLAKKCLKKNWHVVSVSTKYPNKNRKLVGIKYHFFNISKKKNFKILDRYNFDYVVNLSGYVDHSKRKEVFKSHYLGAKNLVDYFKSKSLKSFIQIGSSSEYGKISSPQKETSKTNPSTAYGKSKFLATEYMIKVFNETGLPVSVIRFYQTYGPNQDFNRLIPIVIRACILKKHFPCSLGLQYRDFTYIDDVINSIILVLKSKKVNGKIINIGSTSPIKIKNLILQIRSKIKNGFPEFGRIKLRNDEGLYVYPDTRIAKKILSWSPKISLEVGLNRTINFYKKFLKNKK